MLEVSERARQLLVVTIVVLVICTISGLSISNEDCVVLHKGNMSLDQLFSSILYVGLRSGGRQVPEEI